MEKNNEPAHPIAGYDQNTLTHDIRAYGLSKREYFAGLAFQGLMANGGSDFNDHHTEYVAALSVKYADALLLELEKTQS